MQHRIDRALLQSLAEEASRPLGVAAFQGRPRFGRDHFTPAQPRNARGNEQSWDGHKKAPTRTTLVTWAMAMVGMIGASARGVPGDDRNPSAFLTLRQGPTAASAEPAPEL